MNESEPVLPHSEYVADPPRRNFARPTLVEAGVPKARAEQDTTGPPGVAHPGWLASDRKRRAEQMLYFWALPVCAALLASVTFEASELSAQTQPTSITVSPLDAQRTVGQTQQFAASSVNTLQLGQGGAIAAGALSTMKDMVFPK